ncbi:MAG: PAS domain S-box protein [Phycisphaerae bacterium]|jgi:PAS domain S-box-containing protein
MSPQRLPSKTDRAATEEAPNGSEKGRGERSGSTVAHKALFEKAPDAILVVDSEGRYIDANPAACLLTGYSRAEILRKRLGDLTTSAEKALSFERFELLQMEGRTRRDRVLKRKDGSEVPVEAHAVEVGGGVYMTILRDISERLGEQAELRRSLEAYSTLVDLCHAAVVAADQEGRITSWNAAAEGLFGYGAQQAIGMPITELIPSRLRGAHLAGFGQHLSSDNATLFGRTFCSRGLHRDGHEVPIEVSAAVGSQGGRRVFTAVIRDVTEQEQVLERLNDALQRLQFHVERMPLAYIVWDVDFKVMEWNPAAERIFGYTKSEAKGRHAYELVVPSDVVSAVDTVWDDLLKGDTSSHSINENVRKDGSRLTCEWFNTPLRDSGGEIRGVASMAMDISEREVLEAQIRDAQKLESLGVMAGGVAHDFNSSLMVILGNTALLRSMKGMPGRAEEHIELIEQAGGRANALIKHLLAYARSGRHKPQATDLNGLIREAATFIQSSIGRQYELELKLGEGIPDIVADQGQIEQVLLNLCLNASQAMEPHGTVSIVTRATRLTRRDVARCAPYDAKPGAYVELSVKDAGHGMDEATVRRVFDPFFTTKSEGHGLGMAAVMGILRQHRAAALIESVVNEGTTVRVFFPVSGKGDEPNRADRT